MFLAHFECNKKLNSAVFGFDFFFKMRIRFFSVNFFFRNKYFLDGIFFRCKVFFIIEKI